MQGGMGSMATDRTGETGPSSEPTSQPTNPPPAPARPVAFDALGHCTTCGINNLAIVRLDALVAARAATPVHTHPDCKHVMVYRSGGLR